MTLTRALQRLALWGRRKWRARGARFGASLVGSALLHGAVILLLIFGRGDTGVLPDDRPLAIAVVEEDLAPAVFPSTQQAAKEPPASIGRKTETPGQAVATAPKNAALSVSELLMLAVEAHKSSDMSAAARHDYGPELVLRGGGEKADAYGQFGNAALKDFIRAQVERRWQVQADDVKASHWIIRVHLIVAGDGTVDTVETIKDPQHSKNETYLAVARSARDAVLLSSPLQLPDGTPKDTMDLTLDLDTRDTGR